MTRLSVYAQGGFLLVEFQGTPILNSFIAEETGRELQGLFMQDNQKDMVLDFTNVQLMTSAMINEFLKLQRLCDQHGKKLLFFNISTDIRDVLKACRLEKVFRVVSTKGDVAKELAKG